MHTQYTRLADVTNRHKRKYKQKYMDRSIENILLFAVIDPQDIQKFTEAQATDPKLK